MLPYSLDEIFKALYQMHLGKAPGSNDMNLYFFQKYWSIMDDDVCKFVLGILNGHKTPNRLNHTYVTLIPKKI